MELVDGENLSAWLRGGARTEVEIVDAFTAAGRGLAAAHAAGITHRDFKPHNVLRSARGEVMVTDFGLARQAEPPDVEAPERPSVSDLGGASDAHDEAMRRSRPPDALTMTGAFVGTPAYMAPEQWQGGAIGPAADQFAFCVSLWEALTGARPFGGDTHDALRAEITRGPSAAAVAAVPARYRRVLLRGLSPDPALRWPTMAALLAALAAARAPRPHRGRIAAALAAAMLAIGGGAWLVRGDEEHAAAPAPPRAVTDELGHVFIPVPLPELLASIHAVDATHYTVPAATVAQLGLDWPQLEAGARLVPTTGEDDAMTGFKLFAIQPGSLYAALGLRNGDLVRAVDGIALTTNAQLVAAYRDVARAARVVIDVERAGQPVQIVVAVAR